MNSVNLTGYLGRDPELKKTQSGKSVVNLSVGVSDGYGDNKKTHWINVIVWEKKAEYAANYLSTGSRVAVNGKLTQRSWEDNTGKKQYAVEVHAFEIENLTPKDKEETQQYQSYTPEPTPDDGPVLDIASDDLPF
ncbi:single-stranded DNA-binding protein [Erysipelothrix sp. HDW6C]|uniref:single-stranded DNA-binding protein n=1 Tax=Erysipelothrix sp. HDW6C TaxID=2714930 RepID=UPI00140AA00E|nr:single-stranded DNA-binding protein [Erysipelothrix sp. HDW6C]QIK70854.1 single-stranded DNA-binding protein [Erysipelothrix sp. HDW6C]